MNELRFSYSRKRLFPGFDGKTCKFDPKIMIDEKGTAVLLYTEAQLSGSDVFTNSFASISCDGGNSFSTPQKLTRIGEVLDGIRYHVTIITAYYNRFYRKWIILGFRHHYADDRSPICVGGISVGEAVWTTFDLDRCDWNTIVKPIPLPFETITAVPHGQIIEYENGEMLFSFYVTPKGRSIGCSLTARYALNENDLCLVRCGKLLIGDGYKRGFCEPSVACLKGKYYMTIRTDEQGLLSVSEDGYSFCKPEPWRFDDGSILGNYNTMQRWIRHPDGLYLAYTRRGAHNDHVFRHRAPMFMSRFDEDHFCLLRDTEIILVPELGARLGNYSVTDVSDCESWLITAEYMSPAGCERYGSDNSIWIAKVCWE